jgi:hypothetical protein
MEIIAIVVAVATVVAIYLNNRSKKNGSSSGEPISERGLYAKTKPELIDIARELGLETKGYTYLTKEMIVLLIREKRGY